MELTDIFPFAPDDGYLILALVNFIGSLIPFVPLPGFLLLATMSVGSEYDLHILALVSAISAALAKQIIFFLSFGSRKILNPKTRKRMKPFERLVKRYGGAAAFFAAATPMPDDIIFIPLGLAKYNAKRFFVATLSGKIVLSYVIVFISHYVGLSFIEPFLENVDDATPIYVGIFLFGAMMTAVVVLVLKLDWQRIMVKFAPWTLDENNDWDEDEEKSKN
ncbi:MAG TPA: VTT domain-containing protein [Nitrosopumilus sp.]|jgi:membrane protein DedA with SNARE-associated domain|nr:VTT domain-containing protein [Nitrosopumilus sp.]